MTDLARRAYDHAWRLDPIVRSLLDTDFYKLLMLQLIWREHRDVRVKLQVINRTRSVRLADEIDIGALREQLDHARTIGLGKRANTSGSPATPSMGSDLSLIHI